MSEKPASLSLPQIRLPVSDEPPVQIVQGVPYRLVLDGRTYTVSPERLRGISSVRVAVGSHGGPVLWTDRGSIPLLEDKARTYTEEPCGPLELVVMSLARELHDRERPGDDWFGLVGSSVTSFCRRTCEARGIDWDWVRAAISNERVSEDVETR